MTFEQITELMKTHDVTTEIVQKTNELNETGFLCCICMLFDAYHDAHRDFDPVANSKKVAVLIDEVNGELGLYEPINNPC